MEARHNTMTHKTYRHIIPVEMISTQVDAIIQAERQPRNYSLEQYFVEDFFTIGNAGLRGIRVDFLERGYEVLDQSHLGLSIDSTLRRADNCKLVECEALELIERKLNTLSTLTSQWAEELNTLNSDHQLRWIQARLKNDNPESEQYDPILLNELKTLFGSAENAEELLIREELIALLGSIELADIVIQAHSQEPSYFIYRILSGAVFLADLLVQHPQRVSSRLLRDNEGAFYFEFTTSEYPLFDLEGDVIATISDEIQTLFKLQSNHQGKLGYKLVNVSTDSDLIHAMMIGMLLSKEDILGEYAENLLQPNEEVTTPPSHSAIKTAAQFSTGAVIGGVPCAIVAFTIGAPLAIIAGAALAGAVSGMSVVATQSARKEAPSSFYSTQSPDLLFSKPTSSPNTDQKSDDVLEVTSATSP